MTAGKASIKVQQSVDWNRSEPNKAMVHYYTVLQTRNTTLHRVGASLRRDQIDELIQLGVEVTII